MENTPQQPNYFRFSDAPQQTEAPKPWFRRPEALKRIGIAFGALVILGFVSVFVLNVIKNLGDGPKSEIDAAKDEVVQRQADCNPTDESCKTQAQTNVARTAGVAQACEGLAGAEFENCVTLVAHDEKDASACEELDGDAQTTCKDTVLLARAADGEGIAICSDITNAAKKNSCEALVTNSARVSGDCAKYGVDTSVCNAEVTIRALLAAGDFAGCAELSEEERANCADLFASTDADADGLSAQQEAELGTSDTNADTDGDGYSDGTEVAAGYNPLK